MAYLRAERELCTFHGWNVLDGFSGVVYNIKQVEGGYNFF